MRYLYGLKGTGHAAELKAILLVSGHEPCLVRGSPKGLSLAPQCNPHIIGSVPVALLLRCSSAVNAGIGGQVGAPAQSAARWRATWAAESYLPAYGDRGTCCTAKK